MSEEKEKIVVLNNVKGLFEYCDLIESVIASDELKKPSVEVYYVPKDLVEQFYKYKQDVRNIFVEIMMSKTIDELERHIKSIIMLYYEVLRIEGYSKKFLSNYLFDAINEPHDIYQGMDVLIGDNVNEELIEEFESKMDNKEFYYEIYKEMVVLLLPMMRGFSARTNVLYNLEKMLSNKINIK